jgi:hypothetical protein
MKKTILSFLLVGSTAMIMAQQQPTNSNLNNNRNATNNNTNTNLNNGRTTNGTVNDPSMTPPTNIPSTTGQPQSDVQLNAAATNMDSTRNGSTNLNNNSTNTNGSMNMPPANQSMNNSTVDLATSGSYQLNVPASVQTQFTTSYPQVSGTRWQQSGDWYVARYVDNGVIRQVSYREDGKTLSSIASPIRKSYVPDEIVSQAIQRYGANLYAIGTTKGSNGQDIYSVTLIENGQARTDWMNTDGSAAADHFRQSDNTVMTQSNQQSASEESNVTTQDSSMNTTNTTNTTTTPAMNNTTQGTQPEVNQQSTLTESQNREQTGSSSTANPEGLNNASGSTVAPRKKQ